MHTRRIGAIAAAVAMSMLPACSTWHGMTARATGSTSASGTPGGVVPGTDVSRMRDPTLPSTASPGRPTFRTYDECRAWLAQQGGGASMADTDPCRNLPRS
jgi:hypothetical protein